MVTLNLEKRERIILSVMALVILYGLFNWIAGASVTKKINISPEVKKNEIKALAGDTSIAISKGALSIAEAYAVNRTEADWLQDPFFAKKDYIEIVQTTKAATKVDAKVNFSYTGYMEYGGRQIAIINGLEYSVGEALDVPGYILRSISPAQVTIGNKADSSVKLEVAIQDLL